MTPEEMRKSWLSGFNKHDTNSVAYQVVKLVHGAAVYDLLTASRAMMPIKDGQRQINVLVHRMIDDNFWIAQGAGVRKLVDKSPWYYQGTGRDNSVWSLRSLLEDMRKQRARYFTREAIFKAEGHEYDVALVRNRYQACLNQASNSGAAFFVPSDCDPDLPCRRHADIDNLTASRADGRKPTDVVNEWVFCSLIKMLVGATESITVLADKHMFHAASDQSRKKDDRYRSDMIVTLDDLQHAHSVICRTFRFISETLLGYGEYDLLPQIRLELLDCFENSDKVPSMKQKLWERWLVAESRIKSYTAWSMEELSASWMPSDPHAKRF